MQKTVKKNKRDGSGKRLSYVVTESGLVENDDSIDDTKDKRRRDSKLLIGSLTEVNEASKRFKVLADRRRSSVKPPNEAEDKKKQIVTSKHKDPKEALEEINALESERRRSSLTIADIAETKRRMSMVNPRLKLRGKDATGNEQDSDPGLQEAETMRKRIQQIGAALMMTKALATMSAPRRARKAIMQAVRVYSDHFLNYFYKSTGKEVLEEAEAQV